MPLFSLTMFLICSSASKLSPVVVTNVFDISLVRAILLAYSSVLVALVVNEYAFWYVVESRWLLLTSQKHLAVWLSDADVVCRRHNHECFRLDVIYDFGYSPQKSSYLTYQDWIDYQILPSPMQVCFNYLVISYIHSVLVEIRWWPMMVQSGHTRTNVR